MSKDLYAMALTVGQQSASMDGYLQAVSTIPMLKVEQEQELAKDFRKKAILVLQSNSLCRICAL